MEEENQSKFTLRLIHKQENYQQIFICFRNCVTFLRLVRVSAVCAEMKLILARCGFSQSDSSSESV